MFSALTKRGLSFEHELDITARTVLCMVGCCLQNQRTIMIGVDGHGFTPIVGRALGNELLVCEVPKEAKMEASGGPKEAQMQLKSLLGPSGEVVFCLTWRLEGC